MESGDGKVQREAVNVVFRLLEALQRRDALLVSKLLSRLRNLDQANVYFDFGKLVEAMLKEGISGKSLDRIQSYFEGTPFESFFELFSSGGWAGLNRNGTPNP